MNENKKDKEIDPSSLRLENEALNKAMPEVEVEVEIDESDITMIDDNADAPPGSGLTLEEGPSVLDLASDRANDQSFEIDVEEVEPDIPGDAQTDANIGIEESPSTPSHDGPSVLDLVTGNQAGEEPEMKVEADASDFTGDTPSLDRKVRQLKQGVSSEKPQKEGFSTRLYQSGDIVFKEGDPGNEAYLILRGQVKITRQYKKKSMKINQLGKDQIFGEMAIITGEPRTATAKAVEPTEVFIITEQKLNDNLSQNLAIVKNLIDQLIERMKQLLKQQSTMISKVERSLLIDKKLEVIKAQAEAYEKKKSSEMDEKLKGLFESLMKL